MSDLNQCNFIGRLGADPEIKYLPNGDPVANFSIAVSEKYKDKNGEQRENTEWIRVVAFRKLAEIMGQYLKKGSRIFISGKMKTRKWTDNNGIERYTTEIIADQMQMLDSKDDGNRGQNDHGRNNRTQNEYGSNRHDYRDSSGNHYGNRNGPGNRPPARQRDDFEDDDIPF